LHVFRCPPHPPTGVADTFNPERSNSNDAATDDTMQMRCISGDGAQALLSNRYSAEQDEAFVAGMRTQFGL
jgi:hypothetical protein